MRLIDALNTLNAARGRPDRVEFDLLCGFQPLHLATLLGARLQQVEPRARVHIREGRYGDLAGNLERAAQAPCRGAAVVVEWDDLDPRLGIRHAGSWSHDRLADVLDNAERSLARLESALAALADAEPVALCLPTLPLPPVALTPTWQASPLGTALAECIASFAARAGNVPGLRLLDHGHLDRVSPAPRRSARSELTTGFPYTHAHADAVARALARLLVPPVPKKGLITDLDDTLWSGILGEVGVDGVVWDLDDGAQQHGLYQALLAALAASGVLVAVVSRNDPALVEQAFERGDLRLSASQVFPIIARWSSKSDAVAEVLQAWNVGPESVVFVDDSPLELAEVQQRFPEIECIAFPSRDADAVLVLLEDLRDRFGKEHVQAEDVLRLESLRTSSRLQGAAAAGGPVDADAFLSTLDARIRVRAGADVARRAFELVNKTNQFNLNGERYGEAEWRSLLAAPGSFVLGLDYEDKFGPLGTIAVVTGRRAGDEVRVERWVMSCRAFARRIEHATLRLLFEELGATAALLDFRPTDRNGPLREFLAELVDVPSAPALLRITREDFEAACAPTFHAVARSEAHELARG